MKFLLAVFLISQCFASGEIIKHKIHERGLHKGGHIMFKMVDQTEDQFITKLRYKLKKKKLVPVPDKVLKGELEQALPAKFMYEDAYIELSEVGEMSIDKAKLVYLGRQDFVDSEHEYLNGYLFEILPDNGKWKGEVLYHPDLPSIGWVTMKLTLLSVPVISPYLIEATLDEVIVPEEKKEETIPVQSAEVLN